MIFFFFLHSTYLNTLLEARRPNTLTLSYPLPCYTSSECCHYI